MANEMGQRFPTRQPRYQPYYPRHSYAAPSRTTIPNRHPRFRRSTFTKNVLLLAHDSSDVVPRGARREQLHDAGQIANLVAFCNDWTEHEVVQHLEDRFATLLDLTKPFPRYIIMYIDS